MQKLRIILLERIKRTWEKRILLKRLVQDVRIMSFSVLYDNRSGRVERHEEHIHYDRVRRI